MGKVLAILLLALWATVGLLPGSAGFAAQGTVWSIPQNISNNHGNSQVPSIAVDGQENLYVVWKDDTTGSSGLLCSTRSVSDADWSAPQSIPGTSAAPGDPRIAVDHQGSLHVVWEDSIGGESAIFWALRSSDGSWSAPQKITGSSDNSSAPDIAVDAQGNPQVVWKEELTRGNAGIKYAARSGQADWLTQNISNNQGGSDSPSIAIDGEGNLHVVWQDSSLQITGGYLDILYAAKPSDGGWSAPVNISNSQRPSAHPRIAVDGENNPHVVWEDTYDEYATDIRPQYNTRSGGSWLAQPENILPSSTEGIMFCHPDIALDPAGKPQVVWYDNTRQTTDGYPIWSIGYDIRQDNGEWFTWPNISLNSLVATEASIAIDASGNAHVVWQQSTTQGDIDIAYSTLPTSAPDKPSNSSPQDGATDVSLTPTLQSSAFSDPESTDSHHASQWQVTTTRGDYSSPVFNSGADTSNLTQISIPSDTLAYNTTYCWHVRYQDSYGNWSSYSDETSFTTTTSGQQPPATNGHSSWLTPPVIGGIAAGVVALAVVSWLLFRRRPKAGTEG
ncbi:MAG: hypothetical protein NTZ04_01225 [Chloroflexi bacterium]|nr:hypothetical protein [Chloroflexota bacterium]